MSTHVFGAGIVLLSPTNSTIAVTATPVEQPRNLDDFPTEEEKCEAIWNYSPAYAEEALTLLTTLHGYTLDELKAAYLGDFAR